MKEYLGSLVKIVVFGNVLFSTVHSTYYPPVPPYPYYQDDQYYIPDFAPPYPEPSSVYYSPDNVHPPPLPYENYYSPPQLFQQNKNYNPIETMNHEKTYETPPSVPSDQEPRYPQYGSLRVAMIQDPEHDLVNMGNPADLRHQDFSKNKVYLPYYFDDLSTSEESDDYSENLGEEVPQQLKPCSENSPYQYFQVDPNNPNIKIPLCKAKPNFVNAMYGLRAPITFFPSSFPPMIENLLHKIQSYFSTYVEKETKKPLNQTEPTTTDAPPDVTNESPQEEDNNKVTAEDVQPPAQESPEMAVTAGPLENEEVVEDQSETAPESDALSTEQPDVSDESQTESLVKVEPGHVILSIGHTQGLGGTDSVKVLPDDDQNETNMATEGTMPSEDEQTNEETKENEVENEETTDQPAENEETTDQPVENEETTDQPVEKDENTPPPESNTTPETETETESHDQANSETSENADDNTIPTTTETNEDNR